jgi:hypothetical protein
MTLLFFGIITFVVYTITSDASRCKNGTNDCLETSPYDNPNDYYGPLN